MSKKLKLSVKKLDKLNACYESLVLIAMYWGKSKIKLTRENLLIAGELQLDWVWFVCKFEGIYFSSELVDKIFDAAEKYSERHYIEYSDAYKERYHRFIWKKIADVFGEAGLLEDDNQWNYVK